MSVRTVKIGSLAPGVNNRLEPTELDTKLPDGTPATFLFGADNVDINQKGYLKRRRGVTSTLTGATHSLWADDLGAFAVMGGTLSKLSSAGAGLAATSVRTGLPAVPLSYSRGGDNDVYWSNGTDIRRVGYADGADHPIITPAPASAPVVTVTTGALLAGTYLITFTASGADGESPATPVQAITVPANGGIAFTSQAAVNVYLSAPNGDIPTFHMSGTSGTIATYTAAGHRCMTLNRSAMPAGQIVRHYNGQMLVASGSVLFISDLYNYGVFNPATGYIPFIEPISVIEPTDGGIYLVADQAYWLGGDLRTTSLDSKLPYGAVPGTSGFSTRYMQAYWMSFAGLVIADEQGNVKNVQEDNLEFSAATAGASLWRERDGMRHLLTTRSGQGPDTAALGCYLDAEVVRMETANDL